MIFLVIVPCILCFVYAWRRRRRLLQENLPPLCGLSWPVVGLAHLWVKGSFWNSLLDIQIDCLKRRCVTLLYAGTNPNYTHYAICDPKDCARVTESCLERAFLVADSLKAVFGDSLVTSSVPIWEIRRKHMNTAFDQLCSTDVAIKHARHLVNDLAVKVGKGSFDPTRQVKSSVMRILLSTVFCINNDDETFMKNVDLCMNLMDDISSSLFIRHKNLFMHNKLLFYVTRSRRKLRSAMRTLSTVFNNIINERNKIKHNGDILQDDQGIKSQNNCAKGLSDYLLELKTQDLYSEEDVKKELLTIIFSGYSTTSIAMNCVLNLLGSHKDVQDKVYEEINRTFKGSIENIKKEHIPKLLYLDAVIMETLRLYPPVTILTRAIDKTIQLSKYTLDPLSKCLICVYAMNRHSLWGDDVEQFRPERWLDEALPKAFASFGLGQRDCIGKQFSLDVMKILIVNLLKEYSVSTTGDKIEVKQEIFLSPLKGHHVILQLRNLTV